MRPNSVALSILLLLTSISFVNGQNEKIFSWGDQGNGMFNNPILKSDYSDPDILRHGDDFYLIASDFHFVGMQILHSRDLVNWQIVGQIFDRLTMAAKYDEMKAYSQGTWAPALRVHQLRTDDRDDPGCLVGSPLLSSSSPASRLFVEVPSSKPPGC